MDDQYHTSIRPTRAIPRVQAMQKEPPSRLARTLRRLAPASGHAVRAPRELVDIPEVRALLRRLEAHWPYWAYFINRVDDSVELLLSCAACSRFLGRGAV